MMLLVFSIIVIALFIEAVVGALKPLWKADGTPMTVTEMVSIGIGILIAVLTKMDIVSYACDYLLLQWRTAGGCCRAYGADPTKAGAAL